MCGVFGFITTDGKGPDIERLRRLALVTQTRGRHAFGLAWIDGGGEIRTFRQPGPAEAFLDELASCRASVAMIGHCRLATHGAPEDNRNNHPHAAGGGQLVHNGMVANYRQLARQHRLDLRTECDSEVLALMMARCGGAIIRRAAWAANQAEGELALLGLWRSPARLMVARRGRPLHFGRAAEGFYFASLPNGLPGRVQPVADATARVVAYEAGTLRFDGEAVRLRNY
jgi:glucosamine 6-phosphate synthetase-like amidotransferase/phosphosugar isomerase protein